MCRRTLPLNALRAFEAAARHRSLSKAAEELSVTPAAIHHQVKALEVLLGVPLFGRSGNSLKLTGAAEASLPTLEGAFDLLALAIEKMRQHTSGGVLSLAVCPSFAMKWLVPRLQRFRNDFTGIELRISTTTDFPDLASTEVDVVVAYGPEERFRYPGVVAERLLGDEVFPVCSPKYVKQNELGSPEALAGAVLLHDDQALAEQGIDWNSWFVAAGVQSLIEAQSIRFDSIGLAINAAIAGQGVALARSSLIADDLASGQLVPLFNQRLTVNGGYFVAHLESIADQPKVAAFREWLFAEASLERAAIGPIRAFAAA
nr:transcriptional regulator GcvA [Hypericibacter terrae]